MQKYTATVVDPATNALDQSQSTDDWKLFISWIKGRITKLDEDLKTAKRQSWLLIAASAACILAVFRLWPLAAIVLSLLFLGYIRWVPKRYNPIAQARYKWIHKQRWVVEYSRQTAMDATIPLEQ